MQSSGGASLAESLGISASSIVLELGFDDDSSQEIRDAFVAASGNALVDEDFSDVADVALVWFRSEDDDLVDLLVDAIAPLSETGAVWLMTPKPGREGHVTPADIADAAPTAGLQVTRTLSASKDWQGTRLVIPKGNRR
ncbi:MAG: hypothetical protein RL410_220 [Actinomycetota bacterium]|jgi:hypothetical protein